MQKSMSLKYEPASEPLHFSAKQFFLPSQVFTHGPSRGYFKRKFSKKMSAQQKALLGDKLTKEPIAPNRKPGIPRRASRGLVQARMIDLGFVGSTYSHSSHPHGGVPREQKILKGHLPRVIYHQVYWCMKKKSRWV